MKRLWLCHCVCDFVFLSIFYCGLQ